MSLTQFEEIKMHWGPCGVALFVVATAMPALANDSKFTFKMEHAEVNGKENKVAHGLDAGALTISGKLWVVHCVSAATGPRVVEIKIYKDGVMDALLCSFGVSPSKTAGNKVSFSVPCGDISPSVVYVIASKVDDGCTIEAGGALTTK